MDPPVKQSAVLLSTDGQNKVDYSTVSRWKKREKRFKSADAKIVSWSDSDLSFGLSEQMMDLFQSTEGCACEFCRVKRPCLDAIHNVNRILLFLAECNTDKHPSRKKVFDLDPFLQSSKENSPPNQRNIAAQTAVMERRIAAMHRTTDLVNAKTAAIQASTCVLFKANHVSTLACKILVKHQNVHNEIVRGLIDERSKLMCYGEDVRTMYARLDRETRRLRISPTDDKKESQTQHGKHDSFRQELKKFHEFVTAMFRNAHRTDRAVDGIESTVATILDWEPQSSMKRSRITPRPPKPVVEDNCNERHHPVLLAIMFRLASDFKEEDNESPLHHERNSHIMHQKFFEDGSGKVSIRRRVDLAMQRVQERLDAVLHNVCFVPIKSGNLSLEHNSGYRDVVSSLRGLTDHQLQLGGVGSDCKCNGAVFSLAAVEIIEMELSNVGTKRVEVQLQRTTPYLLFDREITTKLVGNERDWSGFRAFSGSNPCQGFEVIAALLRRPVKERPPLINGHVSYQDNKLFEQRLVELLRVGVFGTFYKLNENAVVKIPAGPKDVKGLEKERYMLKDVLDHECIPKAESDELGIATFHRQCEISQLPSLRLSGIIGLALSEVKLNKDQLMTVFKCVLSALNHAHCKNVVHLNIQPNQIVVDGATLKVQLSDWTYARFMNDKLKGFWGDTRFAHDDIHSKDKSDEWNPKAEHDLASFAYTVIAACLKDPCDNELWSKSRCSEGATEYMLEERKAISLDIVHAGDLDEEWKRQLKQWLLTPTRPSHQKMPISAQVRKRQHAEDNGQRKKMKL